jgi:hypothetical protein
LPAPKNVTICIHIALPLIADGCGHHVRLVDHSTEWCARSELDRRAAATSSQAQE